MSAAVFGDVTSANVVGYQNKDIVNGDYNFRVATFDKVDGSAMKLGDIGVDPDTYFGSTLSFMDEKKSVIKKFDNIPGVEGMVEGYFMYWFEGDLEGTDYEGKPGWYFSDENSEIHPCNQLPVPFGSMFYLEGAEDTALVFSGVVVPEVQPVDIVNGNYNFTGNCSPVDLTLGDIGVDADTYFGSTLSFLDEKKSVIKKFDNIPGVEGTVEGYFMYWFEGDLEGTDYEGKPGWYFSDENSEIHPCNQLPVPAGSAFYLEGAEDTQILIPSALQ